MLEEVKNVEALANTHESDSLLQILVVPQLWLWKFDSEC